MRRPKVLYFAYGSNMSIKRMRERVPSATIVSIGRLKNHQLKFHKVGKNDGSGKCDISENVDHRSEVIGVVFDIEAKGKKFLDEKEGLGNGYEQKNVEVIDAQGKTITAFTYYATNIDNTVKPYTWYKEHVVRGAKENSFPEEYVDFLEGIEALEDSDGERHKKELKIYR